MSPSSAPLLRVRGLARRFGRRTVFEQVSFDLARGEIVSLVGPSGCGKSTLLRAIAGLDGHAEGSVLLEQQLQRGPSDRIGVIFQEPRLLPWLSVADNIAFAAGPRQGHDPRVDTLLAEVGLSGVRDALPKQLSGGMAQRVALARDCSRSRTCCCSMNRSAPSTPSHARDFSVSCLRSRTRTERRYCSSRMIWTKRFTCPIVFCCCRHPAMTCRAASRAKYMSMRHGLETCAILRWTRCEIPCWTVSHRVRSRFAHVIHATDGCACVKPAACPSCAARRRPRRCSRSPARGGQLRGVRH